jgi:hypothetical protein
MTYGQSCEVYRRKVFNFVTGKKDNEDDADDDDGDNNNNDNNAIQSTFIDIQD